MRCMGCFLLGLGCGEPVALQPGGHVDRFDQVGNDTVDILFVVDDSQSMAEEHEALAHGFGALAKQLLDARADFHIGVVSTSVDPALGRAGVLQGTPPFLTREDPELEAQLAARADVGTNGSDKEKGLHAAALAVSAPLRATRNAGFRRDHAALHVIVVSDEDDCSDDGALDGLPASDCYDAPMALLPVADAVRRIESAAGERPWISAIVSPLHEPCGAFGAVGERYLEAVFQTGGAVGSICAPDWDAVLRDLGLTSLGLREQFPLSAVADPATIEVFVNGESAEQSPVDGWTYDEDTIKVIFHGWAVPPRGARIVVTYEVPSPPQR